MAGTRDLMDQCHGEVYVHKEKRNISLAGLKCVKLVPGLAAGCTIKRNRDKAGAVVPDNSEVSMFTWFGPACASFIPGAFDKCSDNENAALIGRHLQSHSKECLKFWKHATELCGEMIFAQCRLGDCKVDTVENWILTQPKPRAKLYTAALDKYHGYNFKSDKAHKRSMFIKSEIQVPPADGPLSMKFPRGIQGLAIPETNMCIGPFMQWVSKSLAKSFLDAKHDWPQFGYTSGSTPEHIGSWYHDMVSSGFNFIEDDFSAYDSTQSEGCHLAEKWFYNKFPGHEMAKQTVAHQSSTVGYGKWWKYSCEYTRKSGDQNTSIGNTYINFLAHAYAIKLYELKHSVSVKYYMIGLGDDNLLAVDVELSKLKQFMAFCETTIISMGLKPKMKVSNTAPSYCSCEFVPVVRNPITTKGPIQTTFLLIPSVLRMMCKIGFTVTPIKFVENFRRLKGNMLGNQNLAMMPILRVFYGFYAKKNVKQDNYFRTSYQCHAPTIGSGFSMSSITMAWFEEIYGLTEKQVYELESFLAGMLEASDGKPSLWNHELVPLMIHTRENILD
jgi:hypothetical protein